MKKICLLVSLFCASATCAVVAACSGSTYTYNFNTNGGNEISAMKVENGESVTLPIPERTGYSFEGWYLSEDCSGSPVSTVVAEGNATYYAKWEQMYALTLNLNGGSLSETTIYLKSGDNVYDAVSELEPVKSGYVFGAWFNGDTELAKNLRMPESALTLTAKYKVEYTIELWLQDETLSEYSKYAEDVTAYDYPGTTMTAEYAVDGFKEITNSNAVTSLTLSDTAANNVFKLYFDREEYQITFVANYPDGSSAENKIVTGYYGIPVNLPTEYTFAGYYPVGWATSATGEAEYGKNNIEYVVFNKDIDDDAESDQFIPERDTALYAVWVKGYIDMFGGNDYIYHFEDDSTVVYLNRGDVYFKGKYNVNSKTFTFINTADDTVVSGKLNDDGTYSYSSDSRASDSAVLYVMGTGVVDTTTIYFDEYNGITYNEKNENNENVISKGTYVIDESGYYHATFTSGVKQGETIVFLRGTITVNNASVNAFQIRNEEEYALGTLYRGAIYQNTLTYYTSAYQLTLNGFGVATYSTGSSSTSYYYSIDESGKNITLVSSYGTTIGIARLMVIGTANAYMFYKSDLDHTYTATDGSTLTLDGLYNATYTKGDKTITGYYASSGTSVFGGTILTFNSSEENHTFIINSTTEQEIESDGTTKSTTTYSFNVKGVGYAEYYHKNSSGVYSVPFVVINDDAEGEATVYGYNTTTSEFEKVSVGTFTYDSNSSRYTYTSETYYANEDVTAIYDFSTIKSFVFSIGTYTATYTSYPINYWYSSTSVDGEVTNYYEAYTSDKNGKLSLLCGYAVYEEDGQNYTGLYSASSDNENLLVITITVNSTSYYLYVEIDNETHKFVTLTTAPYTAYGVTATGNISSTETMSFDGKGGAIYNDGENSVSGTFTDTGKTTDAGYKIYNFKATEGSLTFEFIQVAGSSNYYFAKYNSTYNGTYSSSSDGVLKLDGFGFYAVYTDTNGTNYTSAFYSVVSDNLIAIYVNGAYRYFDIGANKTFTAKGEEYGTYILFNNQSTDGSYVALDGYGTLGVFTLTRNSDNEVVRSYIDEEGTYTNDNGTITLNYKNGSQQITIVGELGTYTYSSTTYYTFVVFYENIVNTYVNESDWSVLTLDGYGNIVKYDTTGAKENGSYVIITDDLLYYVNEAQTDASIFKYDSKNGTINPMKFTQRGYYTEDLESLLFSNYGFAIFNGSTRYYYNVVNGKVLIYQQDAENAKANKYGFVETTFGSFDDEITYEGKTYYANDGYKLSFDRVASTKTQYPITLTDSNSKTVTGSIGALLFTPSGTTEFVVSGTVKIGETTFTCYVTRLVNDDGAVEMYVSIPTTYGYYRFDINLTYKGTNVNGTNNTYEVTKLTQIWDFPSYNYLYYYYLYYMMMGSTVANSFPNSFGEIAITWDYDAEGKASEPNIECVFGSYSGMYDTNGNIITVNNATLENNGTYLIITFVGEDNYSYELNIVPANMSYLGVYGYQVLALVRMQDLVDENSGYTVRVGMIIATDYSYTIGALSSIDLLDNTGKVITADSKRYINDDLYYIVRTKDDNGKITSTTYYKIDLTTRTSSLDEANDNVVQPYESVTVTVEETVTIYTADGTSYVDIVSGNVKLMYINGSTYAVKECSYDSTTGVYTVVTTSGKTYNVSISNNVVTITAVS